MSERIGKRQSKHARQFAEIEAAKDGYRKASTEVLQRRLAIGYLTKVASAAIRGVLKERTGRKSG